MLSWGQTVADGIEVEVTLASLFSDKVAEHIGQRVTGELDLVDKATEVATATYLTKSLGWEKA